MEAILEAAREHEHLAAAATAITALVAHGVADHELGDAAAAASRGLYERVQDPRRGVAEAARRGGGGPVASVTTRPAPGRDTRAHSRATSTPR